MLLYLLNFKYLYRPLQLLIQFCSQHYQLSDAIRIDAQPSHCGALVSVFLPAYCSATSEHVRRCIHWRISKIISTSKMVRKVIFNRLARPDRSTADHGIGSSYINYNIVINRYEFSLCELISNQFLQR